MRALGAKSANGINSIHDLDGADQALGQNPLISPSVFNFYSPEFQIITGTSVVGSLNFFAGFFNDEGYGNGDSRWKLDLSALQALAATLAATMATTC